jgi:putative Mn2+ efflux pump MntP
MKNFLKGLFKDIIDQAWTLLGMAVAWLVLEGSAKDLTGNLILITLGVWVITFPLRYEKPEEEEEEKPAPKKPVARKKPAAKKDVK